MTERIEARRIEYEQPWLTVVAKDLRRSADASIETYYSVQTHDYAAVLAILEDGRVPLVRQYRPAIERRSLELPSGLVEEGEDPAAAVRRELFEETGCEADSVDLIGEFDLDSGRMQTRHWAFFAPSARFVTGEPSGEETDIEVTFVPATDVRRLVREGEFRMAGHLALLAAALVRGLLP